MTNDLYTDTGVELERHVGDETKSEIHMFYENLLKSNWRLLEEGCLNVSFLQCFCSKTIFGLLQRLWMLSFWESTDLSLTTRSSLTALSEIFHQKWNVKDRHSCPHKNFITLGDPLKFYLAPSSAQNLIRPIFLTKYCQSKWRSHHPLLYEGLSVLSN